jgi:hypothetical protein
VPGQACGAPAHPALHAQAAQGLLLLLLSPNVSPTGSIRTGWHADRAFHLSTTTIATHAGM